GGGPVRASCRNACDHGCKRIAGGPLAAEATSGAGVERRVRDYGAAGVSVRAESAVSAICNPPAVFVVLARSLVRGGLFHGCSLVDRSPPAASHSSNASASTLTRRPILMRTPAGSLLMSS